MSDLSNTELAESLREFAEALDKDRGHGKSFVTLLMRDAAARLDAAGKEMDRLDAEVAGLLHDLGAAEARLDDAKKGWTAAENARTRAEARLDAVTRELAKWQRVADGIERACQAAEADRDRAKIKLDTIALIAEQNAERHTGFKHILRVVGLEPGQALRAAATEEEA